MRLRRPQAEAMRETAPCLANSLSVSPFGANLGRFRLAIAPSVYAVTRKRLDLRQPVTSPRKMRQSCECPPQDQIHQRR